MPLFLIIKPAMNFMLPNKVWQHKQNEYRRPAQGWGRNESSLAKRKAAEMQRSGCTDLRW